jgi:hypothetical protein
MEEKKSSVLSEKYIQFIGPLIIFLGVIRLQTYYGEFGINILQFMELGEALTSFLDFIIFIVIYFLTHLMSSFLLEDKPDTFYSDRFQKSLYAGSFFKRFKYYLFDVAQIVFQFGFTIIALYIMSYFTDDKIPRNYIYYTLLIALGVIIIAIIHNEIAFKNHALERSKEKQSFVYLTFFSLLIIGLVLLKSYMQANAVKDNNTFKGVIVELTDYSSICSNETLYYIGKTNNYVFVHNEIDKKTEAIPVSRVTTITFPSPDK